MLKILEKKSPKKTLQIFWKQLEGLATDFAHSYQFNIFFRTKVRVMGLELMFLFGLLTGLYFIANYRFAGMTQPLIEVVAVNSIGVSGWTIVLIVLAFLSAAVIFGYVIAYIALKPTRDALSSQKQFIGNIAHELRTPLSVIKTNIEVAMLEGRMDARMREFMSDNIDELDRSSDIINNLLSFNTLQNPELIKFENTDLGQIVTKVLKKLAALADSKRITLSFEKGEFLTVWGNASALEQVTMNIIKNAIFYTSEGGAVHISVTPNYRGHIELCVTDNGLGIAQDTLLRVFEPFYRAEKSRVKKHGGSGLGLTIVSELIKLHGGKIFIKSKEGEGTLVLVAIPCGETVKPVSIKGDDEDVVARDFSKHKNPKQAAVAAVMS